MKIHFNQQVEIPLKTQGRICQINNNQIYLGKLYMYMCVCAFQFTMTAVIHEHKLDDLNNSNFSSLSSRNQKLKSVSLSHNQGLIRATFPSLAPGKNSYFRLFQILVSADIPQLVAESLQFLPLWSHCLLSPLLCFQISPRSLSYKNTCDSIQCPPGYSNTPPLLKICNLIISAKLFYALQGNIYKFQD